MGAKNSPCNTCRFVSIRNYKVLATYRLYTGGPSRTMSTYARVPQHVGCRVL